MDFVFDSEGLKEDQKIASTKWVKDKVYEIMGEQDDTFCEYITVMIANRKSMNEIASELVAFIGESDANKFALNLGLFLKKITSTSKRILQNAIRSLPIPSTSNTTTNTSADGMAAVVDGGEIQGPSTGIDQPPSAAVLGPLKTKRNSTEEPVTQTTKQLGQLKTSRDGFGKRGVEGERYDRRDQKFRKSTL
jgi:hypothetical protein